MTKIVSWNVNSIRVRLPHLVQLKETIDPDVIMLQETKSTDENFPFDDIKEMGFEIITKGQKSYNGVAILSKIPMELIANELPGNVKDEQARFIECSFDTPIGYARIISLYAPNGGEVGSEKFKIKLNFYDVFTKYINSKKSFEEKLFVGSDYNIAPFDIDAHSPNKLRYSTCFTLAEQKKLRTILNSGFIDNFRAKYPTKKEFSWWDYRAGAFEQNKGMRIDTIISSSNALQNLEDCIIDYKTREKKRPSDHAPVIAIYNV